ncbi:Asp23/Gls24 family envelope stress response protein [Tersicoccus sp. Bi-70]|uniref:Asp23/Gls24 family envelope stress response protein n=1 Tax=Tersicoccus sp. Bi-70 TaxID=1897634 RepID=UPI00097732D9|nr:Asp23/Gls24 family envelope stress response protein [Tersicoccus sp. Bi-70]OMH34083.1 hypothetical protein BGP79_02635 [Tersicoccus sp. Bi-70]
MSTPNTPAKPSGPVKPSDLTPTAGARSTDSLAEENSPLVTSRGTTHVADGVVAKIAGIAARDIEGVHELGGGAARAFGSLRERVGQTDLSQGVHVEVGKTQAAVDVTVVVEYPHPLHEVAARVRDAVFEALEELVGLEVTEVNVDITDVHVPSEDDDRDREQSREQTRESRLA